MHQQEDHGGMDNMNGKEDRLQENRTDPGDREIKRGDKRINMDVLPCSSGGRRCVLCISAFCDSAIMS